MSDSELEVINLRVEIAGKLVCHNLNLKFGKGEIWAMLGQNGAGKSTLMATLVGSRPPTGGEVVLDGAALARCPPRRRSRRLSWLAQHDETPFPTTVLERVLVGRHPYIRRLAWESQEDEHIARAALAQVDMSGREDQDITTLSGGEYRRVAFAAVLSQQTGILLLDEPLAQIDIRHQVAVLRTLTELSRKGHTSIFITHDPNQVARFATHVLLLFGDGKTEAGPVGRVLNPSSLSAVYDCPITQIQDGGSSYFVPQLDPSLQERRGRP